MKIKEKKSKQMLHNDILECRTRVNLVISELRNLKDLS